MGALGGNSAGGGFADLALRTITALIFGAVAMAGMLAGGPYFTLLIATLGAIMVYEWRMIALTMRDRAVAGFQVLAVVGATVMAHFGDMVSALAFLTAIAGAGAASQT